MFKYKKLFSLISIVTLGTLGLGAGLLTKDSQSASAEFAASVPSINKTEYEFLDVNTSSLSRYEKSHDNSYLFVNPSEKFSLQITNQTIEFKDQPTVDENNKPITKDMYNYAYMPDETNPNDYTYFNFDASTIALYYDTDADGAASKVSSGSDNLIALLDKSKFFESHNDSKYIPTYDLMPQRFEMNFSLNVANTEITQTGNEVVLDREGLYTLVLPYTKYHTSNGEQTFDAPEGGTLYYTFTAFNYLTYFTNSNPNLTVNTEQAGIEKRTLTTSLTHSASYFYNYSGTGNELPNFSYNPNRYQVTMTYYKTEGKNTITYKSKIEYDNAGKTISHKEADSLKAGYGEELAEKDRLVDAYIPSEGNDQNLHLVFNNLGEYDLQFDYIYVAGDNTIYTLPLTTKRQKVFCYGYQVSYTDYETEDSSSGVMAESKELKTVVNGEIKESADITHLITEPKQHQQDAYAIDPTSPATGLKTKALQVINDKNEKGEFKINPISTNQVPIKFTSNVTRSSYDAKNQTGGAKIYKVDKDRDLDAGKDFTGENINEPGTYLVIIDYTFDSYAGDNGAPRNTYHHYQVLYFTVRNNIPTISVYDQAGKPIHTLNPEQGQGYTNQNVYIIDENAELDYDAKSIITISAEDFSGNVIIPETNIKNFVGNGLTGLYYTSTFKFDDTTHPANGKTGLWIESGLAPNAKYTVRVTSTAITDYSSRQFIIDTSSISGLSANYVEYVANSSYKARDTIVTYNQNNIAQNIGLSNQPIIFSWQPKLSGANTYGYYQFYPIESLSYYSHSNDSSLLDALLYSLEKPMLPTENKLNLTGLKGWDEYVNAKDVLQKYVPESYVRSQAGLYIFEVYDDAGNSSVIITLLDNTNPIFVKKATPKDGSFDEWTVLSSSDTIAATNAYAQTQILWGKYKGLYINYNENTNPLFSTELKHANNAEIPESDNNDNLQQTIKAFFDSFVETLSIDSLAGSPPDGTINSYDGDYIHIAIANNFFAKHAEDSEYKPLSGNSYSITLLRNDEAIEGTYSILLRDSSNSQGANNEHGFLNYPSGNATITVTSDASRLEVVIPNGDGELTPLMKEGYTLSGNFYSHTKKLNNDTGETETKINKNPEQETDDISWESTSDRFKYSYYQPTKTTKSLSLSYIPRPVNGSEVESIEVEYYAPSTSTTAFETKPSGSKDEVAEKITYITYENEPTTTIPVYPISTETNITEGKVYTFDLALQSGKEVSDGKYVITRKYKAGSEQIIKESYDFFERTLTLIVDRENVISYPQDISTKDKDGKDQFSSQSYIGADILLSMYSEAGQGGINVSFPTLNEYGLNSGLLFSSQTSEDTDISENTDITPRLYTNKLPLTLNVPAYKYTMGHKYIGKKTVGDKDIEANEYSTEFNNLLNSMGDSRIKEVKENGVTSYKVYVEGILAQTFDNESEALAYLAKTQMVSMKLTVEVAYNGEEEFYKSNGTQSNGYLNLYKVNSLLETPTSATPAKFTKPGIYDVTIHQAYGTGSIGEDFKSSYRFRFEVTSTKPEFTLKNADGKVLQSAPGKAGTETYYTNTDELTVEWEDPTSPYLAKINKGNIRVFANNVWTTISAENIITSGNHHHFKLNCKDLTKGNAIQIVMEFEGHDDSYYQKTTKEIVFDKTAPLQNLNSLISKVTSAYPTFDAIYIQTHARKLFAADGTTEIRLDDLLDERYLETRLEEVGYSYTIEENELTNYAYLVNEKYFNLLKESLKSNSNYDWKSADSIYFREIKNYKEYTQTKGTFNEENYFKVKDIDENFTINNAGYYEVIETDYAGNMTVYVVYVAGQGEKDYKDNKKGITYENKLTINSGENACFSDEFIESQKTIYSDTQFKATSLNYRGDEWGIYEIELYGIKRVYMRSPHLSDGEIYQVMGRKFKTVSINSIFNNITHNTRLQNLKVSNRATGINYNVKLAFMDNTQLYYKVTDAEKSVVLTINMPNANTIASIGCVYPLSIKVEKFLESIESKWIELASLSYPNWANQTPNSKVTVSIIGDNLIVTAPVGDKNDKFRFTIIDNFGKTTTFSHLANALKFDTVESTGKIIEISEGSNEVTYISNGQLNYQYNEKIYSCKVYLNDKEVDWNSYPYKGFDGIVSLRFGSTESNYDKLYTLKLFDSETGVHESTVYIRLYNRLPVFTTSEDDLKDESVQKLWVRDNYNKLINNATSRTETVKFNGKVYTGSAHVINTYSTNLTVQFDNGQKLNAAHPNAHSKGYSYSVYASYDGANWININNMYNGFTLKTDGSEKLNCKLLIVYDDLFNYACEIYDINILDSESAHYYVMVDDQIVEKANIILTAPDDPTQQYGTNYIVAVDYYHDSDRVKIIPAPGFEVIYQGFIPTTDPSIRINHYKFQGKEATNKNLTGEFTVLYLKPESKFLNTLNWQDPSGDLPSLLDETSKTITAYEKDGQAGKAHPLEKLKLTWSGYYGIRENAVEIEIEKWFDGRYIPVNIETHTNGDERYGYITRAGKYRIKFHDQSSPRNYQTFGSGNVTELELTFINNVPFLVTYNDENGQSITTEPFEHAVFNGEVKITLADLSTYFRDGYPTVEVKRNGKSISVTPSNYVYSFNQPGYYVVSFVIPENGTKIRTADYAFTILGKNESRYAYEFSPYKNYHITKVVRDGDDITADLVALSNNNLIINGKPYLSRLSVSCFDDKTGTGRYTVTINTGDPYYSNITSSSFTFDFWINDATPLINVSVGRGESTTNRIYATFDAYSLYETVGDCVIKIGSQETPINADTLEAVGGANATVYVPEAEGTYYIQIFTTGGNLLFSYKVVKTKPLDTWTIIAIVIAVIAVVAIALITILLRKRLKVK